MSSGAGELKKSAADHRPACSLCQHSCDERWVGDGTRSFCTTCMKSIGRFLSSDSRRTDLWPALIETPCPPSEHQASEPERPNPHAISLDQLHGEVFVDLSKHPKVILGPADAETHLDLAIAYREMALIGDAVEEAALALRSEEYLTRPRAREALRLVFDRRHLRIDVEETLVALRKAMFAN